MTYKGNIWNDRVAVFNCSTDDIRQGEVVTIWGTVRGYYEYTSVSGSSMLMPSIGAQFIE